MNLAADSGTTIRLGPGTFRGNELLPTGRQIPVALADHIVEPVGLRDGLHCQFDWSTEKIKTVVSRLRLLLLQEYLQLGLTACG